MFLNKVTFIFKSQLYLPDINFIETSNIISRYSKHILQTVTRCILAFNNFYLSVTHFVRHYRKGSTMPNV